MLDTIELGPREHARAAVIWMHGLGADGHDFEPIVPYLGLPPEAAVRIVFPHAPVRPVTVNGGMSMRAWYDIRALDIDRSQDEAGIRASEAQITALVEREVERGVAAERVVLAGFSQGAAMALHVGLRLATPPAGVLALSCYLLLPERLSSERHPNNSSLPILMAHGTVDPVVPLALGRASRDRLQALGYQPEWLEYPMGHEVNMEEIRMIGAWLRRLPALAPNAI